MDFKPQSRWSKDEIAEYEGTLAEDITVCRRDFLEPLRAVYSGWVGIHEGNHDLRPKAYLERYAPALRGTDAFNLDTMLDFDGFGIQQLPDFYDFAPGWMTTHGHKGKIRLTQIAGNTAMGAAQKMHKSVIMGHTHRLGMGGYTYGYDGDDSRTVWGIEVGHLMDMKQADYLSGGTANWQKGFVILEVDKGKVQAQLIEITRKGFRVYGQEYKL